MKRLVLIIVALRFYNMFFILIKRYFIRVLDLVINLIPEVVSSQNLEIILIVLLRIIVFIVRTNYFSNRIVCSVISVTNVDCSHLPIIEFPLNDAHHLRSSWFDIIFDWSWHFERRVIRNMLRSVIYF